MGDVLVLGYHLVDPACDDEMSVPPTRLREQVVALLDRGYQPRTWTQAVAAPADGPPLLAVTFDDAFAGTYRHAAPVLAELGVVATAFVPTALVTAGRPLSWPGLERHALTERQRTPATWSQLRELAGEGWEVGSHSRTHPRLDLCHDALLADELQGSAAECEDHLQRACTALAYPFGAAGPRVVRAAAAAGYRSAALLGCQDRVASTGDGVPALRSLTLPRVGVYHGDTRLRLRLKVSPLARAPWFCRGLDHVRRSAGRARGALAPAGG